jgi:putative phosphoribosyl transferase
MIMRLSPAQSAIHEDVRIDTHAGPIEGALTVPAGAVGIVVFAHGSGSSRFSPRNQLVAHELENRGLGTLLFDLLTAHEERVDAVTGDYRFDVRLLAERLSTATNWLVGNPSWLAGNPSTRRLAVGYFGASTGAAAALMAAAHRGDVAAIVSRGGRPDLAEGALRLIRAPTLLIVFTSIARRAVSSSGAPTARCIWFPAPAICSKSRALSKRSPGSPATGLNSTSSKHPRINQSAQQPPRHVIAPTLLTNPKHAPSSSTP